MHAIDKVNEPAWLVQDCDDNDMVNRGEAYKTASILNRVSVIVIIYGTGEK